MGGKEEKFQLLIHVTKMIVSVNVTKNSCEAVSARAVAKRSLKSAI